MSARKPRGIHIAGNWKMNFGLAETRSFFAELREKSSLATAQLREGINQGQVKASLFVPTVNLIPAQEAAQSLRSTLPVQVGAQNAHGEKKGAFTGEVSGPMLLECQIRQVLLGHSERRQFFGETNEGVLKRATGLLEQGLEVLICIGELRSERDSGQTRAVLRKQLTESICRLPAALLTSGRWSLAYEPVWAIGTGLTATPEQAQETQAWIREDLKELLPQAASLAAEIPILYGGSVTPENVSSLLAGPDVDGALVGGASLKPQNFLELLEAGARAI